MKRFLFAALVVPLDEGAWSLLSYKNLPAHQISHSDGIAVTVDASAGPLVHKFATPLRIERISVSATFEGQIKTTDKLGAPGADDFPLRIGFIVAGKKRLSFMQRIAAPDWVKKLYALAPQGQGIDKIEFLNFTPQTHEASFSTRTHPKSELIEERVVGRFVDGKLQQDIAVASDRKVLGLWLSVDGDDTKSRFVTVIKNLVVEERSSPLPVPPPVGE